MTPGSETGALAGRGVVITRPAEQAGALAGLIRDQDGCAILFPALEIVEPRDPHRVNGLVDRLHTFDLAIFISPIAAERAMKVIAARGRLPTHLKLATVGAGGARTLRRFGAASVIAPKARFDSEALLALPEMQSVAGKRVVIFRGEGGRELLGDTLSLRGATVEYAECYRRVTPQADVGPLIEQWERGKVHAFVVTSSKGLRNLHGMLGTVGQARLARTPVFVPHSRIAAVARALGLAVVIETASGDEGIVAALAQYFGRPA